jgi:hypothetical protein
MRNKIVFKTMALTVFVLGIVFGAMMIYNLNQETVIETISQKRGWGFLPLGDGALGAGASGFQYFMVYPHQAVPGTAYASNLSNATAYEFSDSLNTEMTGETPYTQKFDFVLKFRVNTTVGWNTSSSEWMDSWVRANLSVNFDFLADITNSAMTIKQIANNTEYAWYHAYLNNGGAGYQIAKNEKFNCTMIKAEGYY